MRNDCVSPWRSIRDEATLVSSDMIGLHAGRLPAWHADGGRQVANALTLKTALARGTARVLVLCLGRQRRHARARLVSRPGAHRLSRLRRGTRRALWGERPLPSSHLATARWGLDAATRPRDDFLADRRHVHTDRAADAAAPEGSAAARPGLGSERGWHRLQPGLDQCAAPGPARPVCR